MTGADRVPVVSTRGYLDASAQVAALSPCAGMSVEERNMAVDNGTSQTRRKHFAAILGGAAAVMLVGAPEHAVAEEERRERWRRWRRRREERHEERHEERREERREEWRERRRRRRRDRD